ncbi:BQ2448_355 [Microbotryum intermedium]|uniref:BQ2448_355 protein n=1 Tax=Microbotryum intermedium TaxID=269621 RepID=A0A238F8N1_9BASI|nr:BQ2448_355 [Microbotryum intermedium]
MATASTSTMNRDEFLTIGTHCSEASCNQLDFLPFRCPSCSLAYCSEHWRPPNGHTCPRYDARAHDNIIPSCPVCSQPVPHPFSTSSDEAVSTHLESGQCRAMPSHDPSGRPKTPPKTENMCDERKCRTKMVVPIMCETCRKRFCAKHRWGKDHDCPGNVGAGPNRSRNGTRNAMMSGVVGASGGLNVLRRAQEALATATSSTSNGASTNRPIAKPNPGATSTQAAPPVGIQTKEGAKTKHKIMNNLGVPTKIDKRAMAEQQSALKGLEARAKKGLLSEDEKVQYATMQAMYAQKSGVGKDGCRVS